MVGLVHARVPIAEMQSSRATLTRERLERLRQADAIVRQWSEESGFEREVWQFPVVLIPIGAGDQPDSVVLRPIHSVDGMTAQVVRMPHELLHRMTHELHVGERRLRRLLRSDAQAARNHRVGIVQIGENFSKYRAWNTAARWDGHAGSSSDSRWRPARCSSHSIFV